MFGLTLELPRFVWTKSLNTSSNLTATCHCAGWTKIEAIDSLVRKAGYNGEITESVRRRIHLTRYQSTLFSMHYSEYISYVKATRGGVAPAINGTSKPAMAFS